jgi:cardiolipin synthase
VRAWFRQIPNVISSLRILLVIPIALALLHRDLITTMGLFGVAAVSDAADGFLAKRFAWQSSLGAVLDPAADKLLLATVYITLTMSGLVPPWLTAAVVGRDVIIVAGALAYRIWVGAVTVRPSVVSKLNTLFQLCFVLAVIGARRFEFVPGWAIILLGAVVLVTAAVSGLDYVLTFGRLAYENRHAAAAGETGHA